jgi:deoxyribonuclease IV
MPLFGSHLSIAGGLYKAVDAAAELGMSTVQIFTHSPSQWSVKAATKDVSASTRPSKSVEQSSPLWHGKVLADEDIRKFREAIERSGIQRPCAHDSYLINLASPDDTLWQKSLEAIIAELVRAESLGLEGVVMHPGSFVTSTEADGQRRIIEGLNEAHHRTKGFRCQYWLETTAGQGTNLGYRFDQIALILDAVQEPERLGVCVDSCHIFAAGYALTTAAEYAATMNEFDDVIGIGRIRAWHLNDSKKPLGSRVDRHEHIGEGCLGLEPFRHIVNDPRFQDTPMYLETEKGERDGQNLDAMNLSTLNSLIAPTTGKTQKRSLRRN